MIRGLIAILLILSYSVEGAFDQNNGRVKLTINDGWTFKLGPVASSAEEWANVTLPHTWNTTDPFDDEPGYYRGEGNYRRQILVSAEQLKDRKFFLHFEAVNQVAEVFVNGSKAGEHRGGYTAFTISVTSFLRAGENTVLVRVNNQHDPSIVPLKGDFNFYGGIYRDVYLIETSKTHFNLEDHGSMGVYYDYILDNDNAGELSVTSKVIGTQPYSVTTMLHDKSGKEVASTTQKGESVKLIQTSLKLDDLQLWSPETPYLYTLVSEIVGNDNVVLDRVELPVGFRTIRFDANYGCFINNRPYKLHGVNRHQDYEGLGNALTNEMHARDIELIKSLGATFLRTAHYPQDPAVLEACDRLGIVVSMEIPIDHDMTSSEDFKKTTSTMMREMIRQYRHHPSIAIWAYMNEMFLGKNLDRDKTYIQNVVDYSKELNSIAKREDPARHTMIANHGDMQVYTKSGLANVPDIIGWNLYFGWYGADCTAFGRFVDAFHQDFPSKPVVITEFGAGSDVRIHSLNPERFDYSIEWQNQYFQCYYEQIMERTFIIGTAVWNMFDFGAEQRADAIPHINQKGLCTFDRKPKEAFYIVQSQLSNKPTLKILGPEWLGISGAGNEVEVPVTIVGSVSDVRISVNDTFKEKIRFKSSHTFTARLRAGKNTIDIQTEEGVKDSKVIEVITPESVENISFAMNMGAPFHFSDPALGTKWLPQNESNENTSGVIGGSDYRPRDRGVGTDKGISNTDLDPLYQTVRVGIQSFKKMKVKPGDHTITLHFAELEKDSGERTFDVHVNGDRVFKALDVAAKVGKFHALKLTADVNIQQEFIHVEFKPIKGEPFLNAIQINRK